MAEIEDYNEDDPIKELEEKEQIFEAISDFYSDDIKTKTDIPEREDKITQIIKLEFFAKRIATYRKKNAEFKADEIIDQAIDLYYNLRVSSGRKGRKEFFTAISRLIGEREDTSSFLDRLRRK